MGRPLPGELIGGEIVFGTTVSLNYGFIIYGKCGQNVFKLYKMNDNLIKNAAEIIKYLIIGAICGLFFNLIIMKSPLVDIFPAYQDNIEAKTFSVNIMFGILIYCIAAPIIEELIFRVFLYNWIYSRTGFAAAAVLSSLIFGVYHMNMVQGIYAFIMGVIFCFFYHRDHRIWVPVLMHSGANLAVWLLSQRLFSFAAHSTSTALNYNIFF